MDLVSESPNTRFRDGTPFNDLTRIERVVKKTKNKNKAHFDEAWFLTEKRDKKDLIKKLNIEVE